MQEKERKKEKEGERRRKKEKEGEREDAFNTDKHDRSTYVLPIL